MKVRDSGMADEATWAGFFDPDTILRRLGLATTIGDVVEFGCGYGTFTIPAARIVDATVYTLDIEPEMIEHTRRRAADAGVDNIELRLRDFLVTGSGLDDEAVGYAMVFNILHIQRPADLLGEAYRVLCPGGLLGLVHWNYDPGTPRGPDMSFRPRAAECIAAAEKSGFTKVGGIVDLPPYHWGAVLASTRSPMSRR